MFLISELPGAKRRDTWSSHFTPLRTRCQAFLADADCSHAECSFVGVYKPERLISCTSIATETLQHVIFQVFLKNLPPSLKFFATFSEVFVSFQKLVQTFHPDQLFLSGIFMSRTSLSCHKHHHSNALLNTARSF